MIKFREFLAGTILSKSTVIAKNVRSFFEINCPFESKHDRTQHRSDMTKNMTVVSKSAEGIQSPSFEKGWALFISKRKYLYHIERKAIVIISKWQWIIISKRESIYHFEVTVNHHFEVIVHRHFETTANPSFRNDSAASFQNDSFACDKSPINLKLIYVTHFEMIMNVSFGNDTHRKIFP